MVCQKLLILYFQICLNFAEWIEISKAPIQSGNKSLPKIKTADFNMTTVQHDKDSGHFHKRTFINKVFADEKKMEETLNKSSHEESDKNENYSGFMPFIDNIQSTLIRNAHHGIKSKINLLQELKYNLLFNIKDKISNLWKTTSSREAREYYDKEDDYHMDFPSNEGALMTIGFLTFAVFLIKLVLKLIYALKNKSNAATANTTPVIVGRKKRETLDDEASKILQFIEEFKLNNL